jgi:CheY-like chemotaxis protein
LPLRVRLTHDPLRGGFLPAEVWGGAILSETTKVLLAEDEPNFVRYLVALLEQMSCEIAIERNGEDAIRRAATFQPDVALVGFVMPGMDGSATGIGLLRVSPHTKVVFIAELYCIA